MVVVVGATVVVVVVVVGATVVVVVVVVGATVVVVVVVVIATVVVVVVVVVGGAGTTMCAGRMRMTDPSRTTPVPVNGPAQDGPTETSHRSSEPSRSTLTAWSVTCIQVSPSPRRPRRASSTYTDVASPSWARRRTPISWSPTFPATVPP